MSHHPLTVMAQSFTTFANGPSKGHVFVSIVEEDMDVLLIDLRICNISDMLSMTHNPEGFGESYPVSLGKWAGFDLSVS